MKNILISILLLLVSLTCVADVYTETDSNGNISFSDVPLSDQAKKLSSSEIQQSASPVESRTPPTQAAADDKTLTQPEKISTKKPYTQFAISSPVDQETIQNQPIIPININVDPPLQEGDKIQIFLDGAPWGGAANTTHFELPRPNRGTHKISAKLIDSNQLALKQSQVITVFIHQAHIPTSPPPAVGPT